MDFTSNSYLKLDTYLTFFDDSNPINGRTIYQWIQSLYSESKRQLYSSQLIYNTNTSGDSKACLDPHVYEVSSLAYRGLALNGRHQSILVSGESGAVSITTWSQITISKLSYTRHNPD